MGMRVRAAIVRDDFSSVANLARGRLRALTHATGLEVVAEAKRLVRVETGELRDSIRIISESDLEVVVGTDVAHGPPNEFGTTTMPAQPFLGPAIESARPRHAAALARLLD